MEDVTPAYNEGWFARVDEGLYLDANPYNENTPEHMEWEAGWRDGTLHINTLKHGTGKQPVTADDKLEEIRVDGTRYRRNPTRQTPDIWEHFHEKQQVWYIAGIITWPFLSHIETLQQRCASLERVREALVEYFEFLHRNKVITESELQEAKQIAEQDLTPNARHEREHPKEPSDD